MLNKRSQRQQQKISSLTGMVFELKKSTLVEQQSADNLSLNFDDDVLNVVRNEVMNHSRANQGRRYTESVKQFALTMFYYSPQAYEYLCSVLFPTAHL